MQTSQVNITLGTAGHIDHGKTALVKCLTGCETDRLRIEKERGMSIELGFAPCVVEGLEVGIVDVPGHENFIKTMVAGATGIDGVIFIIAADDGIMPQTKEHLEILTLLGIKHGIVALTKSDCVGPERLDSVKTQIKDFLEGTFLADSAIVPVSSITGEGFADFLDALKGLVGRIEPKRTDGLFRLPVERTFSVKGYGTVVSGIPVAGAANISGEVVILPQGAKGRIRAIQVYSKNSDKVLAGQCAAINVPQWDYKTIERGNVVTVDGFFQPRQWYLVKFAVLPHQGLFIKTGGKVKLHTGTSEVTAVVYLLQGNTVNAGSECVAQLYLAQPIIAAPGDRFIIRMPSPPKTIGGGLIVEATQGRIKRSRPGVVEDALQRALAVSSEKDFAEYCIKTASEYASGGRDTAVRAKLPFAAAEKIIGELLAEKKIVALDTGLYMHRTTYERLCGRIAELVSRYHEDRPESPGIQPAQLGLQTDMNKQVFEALIRLMQAENKIAERKGFLALAGYREKFDPAQEKLLCDFDNAFRQRLFNPPDAEELAAIGQVDTDEVERTIRILVEQQNIVQVEKGLYFHTEAVQQARNRLCEFIKKEGRLESVSFKYMLDTTRKYAIPLLDYFDKIGVTRRLGNTRYLKNG